MKTKRTAALLAAGLMSLSLVAAHGNGNGNHNGNGNGAVNGCVLTGQERRQEAATRRRARC